MSVTYEVRYSDSAFVYNLGWSRADDDGVNYLPADSNCYLFVMKRRGETSIAFGGPLTRVLPLPVLAETEWFGIRFKLGTFLPHLPPSEIVDDVAFLPEASSKSFWLHGSAWEYPTHENADTFIDRLVREGLLVRDPVIECAMQGEPNYLSPRALQRRFLKATGLTQSYVLRIERAQKAAALLQQDVSILDTMHEAGYFDQPHLTRSLKHFFGQTPAEMLRSPLPGQDAAFVQDRVP
jgi:hypothetical protein